MGSEIRGVEESRIDGIEGIEKERANETGEGEMGTEKGEKGGGIPSAHLISSLIFPTIYTWSTIVNEILD